MRILAGTTLQIGDLHYGEFLLPRPVGRSNPDISRLHTEHHLLAVRRKAGTYPFGERPQFLFFLGRENSSFALTPFWLTSSPSRFTIPAVFYRFTVRVAVVAETATEPRDGTGNHRATIGGPSFLLALIQTTILRFPTS